MKKLLMVSNGAQLFRGIASTALALCACLLFSAGVWSLEAQHHPTPNANPGSGGQHDDPNKCTICHVPPGHPAHAQTLTISCSAVEAHLKHHPGDCLGPCPCQVTGKNNP